MKNDELHIITSILAGNTERFSYFLDTYGQQIFTLIVRMVGSPEDAEELTQDTFMKAFRHLSDFNGKSSFSTWLYRIAYNTALSSLRKQPNEVLSVDDRLWNNLTENEIDRALDEEDEERIEQLQRALEKLTPDEEFDAEEVIKIVKRLEELEPTEAPEKSVDEFLDDFWKYCEERESEEKILEEFRKQNSCIYDEKSVVL